MRHLRGVVFALVAGGTLSYAQSPVDTQLQALGFVHWRATIHLDETYKEHGVSRDCDRGKQHALDADVVIVQWGNPPSAPSIDLQMDPNDYAERTASGKGTGAEWSHCPDESDDWTTVATAAAGTPTLEFHLEPTRHTWHVNARLGYATETDAHFASVGPPAHSSSSHDHQPSGYWISFDASNTTPHVKLTHAGKVFTIDGTLETHQQDTVSGTHTTIDKVVHAHIVLVPTSTPKYEAILRPKDPAAYARWIPLGPPIPTGEDTRGASQIAFVLELRDARTHRPARDVRWKASYRLEPSRNPGWCMNYPPKGNDKPDLFFEATKNPAHTAKSELFLAGLRVMGQDQVVVSSRDYGAYGRLFATVALDDGTQLDASADTGGTGISIPLDADQNHIADAWEPDAARGKAATTDDEDDPPGMATAGDGYGLYDEYRGFYASDRDKMVALEQRAANAAPATAAMFQPPPAKFQRLSPKKRELLVAIESNAAARGLLVAGAARYASITGIDVYLVPTASELAPLDGDGDAAHPRWANFNSLAKTDPFGPKQAAVWLIAVARPTPEDPEHPPGQTERSHTYDPDPELQIGSPLATKWSRVYTDYARQLVESYVRLVEAASADAQIWTSTLIWKGLQQHPDLTKQSLAAYIRAHEDVLAQEIIEFSAFHELGHATGGRHHHVQQYRDHHGAQPYSDTKSFGGGDTSCPMRYWHYNDGEALVLFLSGRWNPAAATQTGGAWKFCTSDDDDWAHMQLRDDRAP